MAVADVVGEITGNKPAEDDVVALASSTPNGDGSGPIYGLPALEVDLGEGRKVIASVNGETIWDIPGDRAVHDHALVVTGVDTGTGTVHLNDSAAPHPDTQVSVETFEAAWRTSDHAMVVAG